MPSSLTALEPLIAGASMTGVTATGICTVVSALSSVRPVSDKTLSMVPTLTATLKFTSLSAGALTCKPLARNASNWAAVVVAPGEKVCIEPATTTVIASGRVAG